MGKITIYGTPASRTLRTLWMAKELGIDYDHVPVDFRDGGTRTEAYRKINPNEKIPSIVDGDLALWESFAINLYLAKKQGGPLAPKDLAEDALATQWSMWGLWEIEPLSYRMLLHSELLPAPQRDRDEWQAAADAAAKPLAVLEAHLAEHDWILGDRFTVADMNVAGACNGMLRAGYDFSAFPAVKAWLDRILARPAFAEARALVQQAMAD